MEIRDDNTAVEGIKEKSRPAYIKAWAKFRPFKKTRLNLKLGNQPNWSFSSTSGISGQKKGYGFINHVECGLHTA